MGKALTGVIALIIVVAIIGGAVGYYIYYFDTEDEGKKTPPPPVNKPPIAVFKCLNGTTGRVNDILWFDANGSDDPDGNIVRFVWDFDDGTEVVSNGTLINHTYYSAGEFEVNLTVVDNGGAKDTIVKKLTIRPTDYTAEASAILLSKEPLGYPGNISKTIPIEESAVSLTIIISFMGASLSGSSIENAIIDVIVMNPQEKVIANETKETKIQQININITFEPSEISIPGDYILEIACTQGSLRLNYEIEVLY